VTKKKRLAALAQSEAMTGAALAPIAPIFYHNSPSAAELRCDGLCASRPHQKWL